MRRVHLGQKAWNKGIKKQTNTGRTHFKKGHQPSANWYKVMAPQKDGGHPRWIGDKVGYWALHAWIHRKLGKATKCENPNCFYPRKGKRGYWIKLPPKYHWANISGEYKRDFSDWHQLCQSCNQTDGIKIAGRFKKI